MTDAPPAASVYCPACERDVELSPAAGHRRWSKALVEVPVVYRGRVVGYVNVLRHATCRAFTAIPVRV